MTIFTIGHSTRSLDDFIALLHSHGINRLADIRTVPKSRRHPHFAGDALARSLPTEDVAYRHFPGLGGLRKPKRNSTNTGWRHEGFRGYADYMQTAEFARALEELIGWAHGGPERAAPQLDNNVMRVERAAPQQHEGVARADGAVPPGNVARAFQARVAIMCAEALWWRCHRQLVADALVAPGIEVRHIASASSAPLHTVTDFARVDAGRVSYPGLL